MLNPKLKVLQAVTPGSFTDKPRRYELRGAVEVMNAGAWATYQQRPCGGKLVLLILGAKKLRIWGCACWGFKEAFLALLRDKEAFFAL